MVEIRITNDNNNQQGKPSNDQIQDMMAKMSLEERREVLAKCPHLANYVIADSKTKS